MLRLCKVNYKTYNYSKECEHLVFSSEFWSQGRKYFLENPNIKQITVTDIDEKPICIAWCDEMANQELRMLDEIIRNGENTYHFENMYPNCDCVIIEECNELAYYTAKYIQSRGIPVILRGKLWKYFDIESAPEDIEYYNEMKIYADGTWEHTDDPQLEEAHSVSVEFDCIYYLYMKNIKENKIKKTSRTKEQLFEYLKDKKIYLYGDSQEVQDTYDILLSHGIDIEGFIKNYDYFHIASKINLPDISKLKNDNDTLMIDCHSENSFLGEGEIDSYTYIGFKRDIDIIYIRDYIEITQTLLSNILQNKTLVLVGDELLCKRLYNFWLRNGKNEKEIIFYNDYKEDITQNDVFVIAVFPTIYGYESVSKKDFAKKYSKIKNIENFTDYFSEHIVFIAANINEDKKISSSLKPKGIILSCIHYYSGNIFMRDCIDNHPNIIQLGFTGFENNLFLYCIRLAGLEKKKIMPLFWKLVSSEISNYQSIFHNKECFETKCEELLQTQDVTPTSLELFVIFYIAYNKMKNRDIDNISEYYIYWEPHIYYYLVKEKFTKWFNNIENINKILIHGVRNAVSTFGSRIKYINSSNYREFFEFIYPIAPISNNKWEKIEFKFEETKLYPQKVWENFCKKLDIPWSDTLLSTTLWGNEHSFNYTNSFVTGYDLKPVYNSYPEYLSPLDILRIQICQTEFQKHFCYPYLSCLQFTRKEFHEIFIKEFKMENGLTFDNTDEMVVYYLNKIVYLRNILKKNYNKVFFNEEDCKITCEIQNIEEIEKLQKIKKLKITDRNSIKVIDQVMSEITVKNASIWTKINIISNNNNNILTNYFIKNNIKNVVVYGLGKFGNKIINELRKTNIKIVAGIDKNVTEFDGLYVISPEDSIPECDMVIVSPAECYDILEILRKKGVKNICTLSELVDNILYPPTEP